MSTPPATDPQPVLPSPRYIPDKLLGMGGMAAVWRAWRIHCDGTRDRVALKQLLPKYRHLADASRRLVQEGKLYLRYDETNLLRAYDIEGHGDDFTLVLEYIDGITLDVLQDNGSIPPAIVRRILFAVLNALEVLHHDGVVHRDLSPRNVMIARDGRVKVLDLGLAKRLALPPSHHQFVGTAAYAGYEALCAGELDPTTDLYALGAVLYELLSGSPPFGIGHHDQLRRRHQRRKHRYPPLQESVPEDLRTLVHKLLAPPGERELQSVSDIVAHLEKYDYPHATTAALAQYVSSLPPSLATTPAPEAVSAVPGKATLADVPPPASGPTRTASAWRRQVAVALCVLVPIALALLFLSAPWDSMSEHEAQEPAPARIVLPRPESRFSMYPREVRP